MEREKQTAKKSERSPPQRRNPRSGAEAAAAAESASKRLGGLRQLTGLLGETFRERAALGIFLVLVAIIIVTAVLNPVFLSPYNLQTLSRQLVIFGLLAIGETFVIITGGIDLSVGSLTALFTVLVAWFMTHGFGVIGGITMTFLIAIAIGLWHGLFVTKLRVPPFIITLGTFAIARGMAAVITRGWPISGLPPGFPQLWEAMVFGVIPLPVAILVGIAALSHILLGYTVVGRHLYAVGGNIEAARRFGIAVDGVRIFTYVVSALMAALVGILIAARLNQGNPTVGGTYELFAIAAAVIGGVSLFGGEGSVIGSLIGASIIGILWNSLVLLRVSAYWHEVAVGSVIVLAVTLDILRRRQVPPS